MGAKTRISLVIIPILLGMLTVGCKTPEPTGFLSDYSRLEKASSTKMNYISPELRDYKAFIVDPIQMRVEEDKSKLKEEQKAEVVKYFHDTLEDLLRERGVTIVSDPGPRVARFRIALTNVQKSKWYLNLHPGSKLSGAAAGGASMEAEVIDSVTGDQLAAVIQAGRGNQFELDHFSSLDDVRDVIDKWAKQAGDRLDEARKQAGQ